MQRQWLNTHPNLLTGTDKEMILLL